MHYIFYYFIFIILMEYNLIKVGGCSMVLGEGHFINYLPTRKNKLLKVTKVLNNHNEFTHLEKIRSIENYENYYAIPDKDIYMLAPDMKFYQHLNNLF